MSEERVTNKNAASEDDVGTLHGLITKAFNMKVGRQVALASKKKGDPDLDINANDLAAAARWVAYNGVKAKGIGEEKLSESIDELEKIKREQRGRVLRAVGADD